MLKRRLEITTKRLTKIAKENGAEGEIYIDNIDINCKPNDKYKKMHISRALMNEEISYI